jgi:L-rhamnose mutarotase
MKRYCLTLDLKNEPNLIEEYAEWHKHVWPEIVESIQSSGIVDMEIYKFNNRLFMIMETDSTFSFEKKASMDAGNKKVQEWESIMWKYQKGIPGAKEDEKWMVMEEVFLLKNAIAETRKVLNHG